MPTIVDALTEATAALEAATAQVLTAVTQAQALHDTTVNTTNTTINNFLARPPAQAIWCDPINGSEANDGSTSAKPRKDLDAIIDEIGITVTGIYLLNDATMHRRHSLIANLTLQGAQIIAAAPGFMFYPRTLTFLGTAENSPDPGAGSFCSGCWCYGVSVTLYDINVPLPDVPADYNYRAHISSSVGTNFILVGGITSAATQNAGALFSSTFRSTVQFTGVTYGPNAPGHLLLGVAAGADPNASFNYVANVTSA